ncbi:MAG: amino acid adenylation domain-containing protein [Defluviitaleaceae bacterium]|nr:amino acid adenylation domain-containing protein [Defluviitaleaceae bacterium]
MKNVLEYLEHTVTHSAGKPAFIDGDGDVNFGQLYHKSRAIGTYLCSHGMRKQPIVVFMKKSTAMITAFLGVAYGGNFYVPLDAEMPAFRIQLILKTTAPPLIICDETTQELISLWGLDIETQLYTDLCQHHVSDEDLACVRLHTTDIDPLYVVFTSGSTGTPKGVVASHQSVIDYIENLSPVLKAGPDTVFGMQSPLYLDACLKEIFPTLKYGATTYIIPPSLFMFPVKLIEYLNMHGINTICWVASALGLVAGLGALEKAVPHTLRTIAFTSEVLPAKHFNKWRELVPDARFVHFYGPTEATGVATFYVADRFFDDGEAIPIGQPFSNTDIVLLDDNNATPAANQPGEICIRGACLSLGYYKDPIKTQAVFVQNPLSCFPDTIYKTGDIGYRDDNGVLYFISRRDHQIKHMGYRIELAEIEYIAARHQSIELACAVFDQDKSRIVLYYTTRSLVDMADIKAYLKATLPRYMMPYAIFALDTLPLTPGGKFDRVGLLNKYKEGR